jgi:zinc/manganese transport system substrate-binding protein
MNNDVQMRTILKTIIGVIAVSSLAACGSSEPDDNARGKIRVVAAESSWGDIAERIGGDRVAVTSVVDNPDVDPHDFEPSVKDAAAFADADLVVVNGLGYDEWAEKAIDANPNENRKVVNVAEVVKKVRPLKDGDNPHRWYSPADVSLVSGEIVSQLARIDTSSAQYFAAQHQQFLDADLREFGSISNTIEERYAGASVAATESVFEPLADDLKLDLVTPPSLMEAVSEGEAMSVADRRTMEDQLRGKQVRALVFNEQNSTPDVQALVDIAKESGVPVVAVTETPAPSTSFAEWQTAQLRTLLDALNK